MFLCSGGFCPDLANLPFGKQSIPIYSFKGI